MKLKIDSPKPTLTTLTGADWFFRSMRDAMKEKGGRDATARKRANTIDTKVAGLHAPGHPDLDALATGDPVTLRHEPDNPFDRHAVTVLTRSGERLGYLPKTLAAEIAPQLAENRIPITGEITRIETYIKKSGIRAIFIQFTRPAPNALADLAVLAAADDVEAVDA